MIKNGIALLAVLVFSAHVFAAGLHIKSKTTGGSWEAASTWVGGVVPAAADTVEIVTGSTVTLGASTGNTAAKVLIFGTLNFATTGLSLTLSDDLIINNGGVFNPFFSSSGKLVTVKGNFTNDGTTDLSKNGFVLTMGQGLSASTIGGGGVFTTGVIRSLTINNTYGVTLSKPLSLSYTLSLTNGVFTNGTNLTMNDKNLGNGTFAPSFCWIQRAQSSSLNNTYTLGGTAVLHISYLTNAAGSNPALPIVTANEIPVSRSFENLTINHTPGISIANDITLTAATGALTLSSGVIKMASGKTITCSSPTNQGTAASNASYVDGAVALSVGTTAATRTFPIGNKGMNRQVVLTGLQSTTGILTVRFVIDTTLTINTGAGIVVNGTRKWKGTIPAGGGTLSKFTSIAINYNTDDIGINNTGLVAFSTNGFNSYDNMGAGTNISSAIVSPVATYTSLGYYALASPFSLVTRVGDKLMTNGTEFRFIGLNAYTLTGIATNGWHFLDDYEVEDVFKTGKQMGVTVFRTIMFSIIGGQANTTQPSHIMGLRTYNEALFQKFDKVLQLANQYKIRLIIPFIGNANSRGGINQLAGFVGKTGAVFYTDPAVRAEYMHFVNYVMTRVNTLTHVMYKDDPAILCWETGNELRIEAEKEDKMPDVDAWTLSVTADMKSIDPNHLIMDGKESTVVCSPHCTTPSQLNNPNIDIITEHYYNPNFVTLCNETRSTTTGKKAFVIGEFDSNYSTVHQQLLQTVINNGTSGALMWSLTNHINSGGFYYKGDPTNPFTPEFRWPGFSTASLPSEAIKMDQIRTYSYQIRNLDVPAKPVPDAPYLIPASTRSHISWQGSTGAEAYILERASNAGGPWTVVDNNAKEDGIPYKPYNDLNIPGSFYYRVTAKNVSGSSSPSNVVLITRDKAYIKSKITGGAWDRASTWEGDIVPAATDSVEVIAGSTVAISSSNESGPLKLSGQIESEIFAPGLTVYGDLTIDAGGVLKAYWGNAGKLISVKGNFINNGTANFTRDKSVLKMDEAGRSTALSGSGVFSSGIARGLTVNNSQGVTLSVPLSIVETLTLTNGVFNNGTNLTLDNTNDGGLGDPFFVTIQRSQSSSLNSTYTLGSAAALYLAYQTNPNGANPTAPIAEALEIPASRSFYNLTVNHAPGINISDDLTLKSSASALTLTSGVITMAAGKTLICTSPTNLGVKGNATSYVDGAIALTAGTTAVTDTFAIGNNGKNRKIVLSGVQASSGTVTVRFVLDNATSATAGAGISLSTTRKWKGTILTGALSKFTKIGIDSQTDDLLGASPVIASSANLNGVYNSMGNGTNVLPQINSPVGTYTAPLYYALANNTAGFMAMAAKSSPDAVVQDRKSDPQAISIVIYPNPASANSETSIKISGLPHQSCDLIITDINGRLMIKQTVYVDCSDYSYKFSTASWKPGVYAISLKGSGLLKQAELLVK